MNTSRVLNNTFMYSGRNGKSAKLISSLGRFVRSESYKLVCTRFCSGRVPGTAPSDSSSESHTPPMSDICSNTVTLWPSRCSSRAVVMPAGPAPTTACTHRRCRLVQDYNTVSAQGRLRIAPLQARFHAYILLHLHTTLRRVRSCFSVAVMPETWSLSVGADPRTHERNLLSSRNRAN